MITVRDERGLARTALDSEVVPTPPKMMVNALGSLSVTFDGVDRDIGKPGARRVLAYLLIRLGEVVPTDLIIDDLWNGEPPASAHHGLQVAVSNLRNVLEPHHRRGSPYELLVTERPGYSMRLCEHEFDVSAATRLIGRGRQSRTGGNLPASESFFIAAERFWKGPPYAEFTYETFAQPEIRRLCELHFGLIEDRIDVQLLLGKHHELVPELEFLALTNPSRERFVQQLMTALVRSHRRGDALRVYGEASRRLWIEFGVTPSHSLADLASQIRHSAGASSSGAR